jgi:lon-related putative ATP-dependent protease
VAARGRKSAVRGKAPATGRLRVPTDRLRWRCPASAVPPDPAGGPELTVGQDRAIEALRLGLEVRAPGYNIYVSGLTGTGRTTTVLQMVKELAPACPVPRDRAFVHNFADAGRPRLLTLPAGKASALKRDVDELISLLKRTLPAVVEDREFLRRRDEIMKRYAGEERGLLDALRADLARDGFALVEISAERAKRLDVVPLVGDEAVPMDRWRETAAAKKVPKEETDAKEARFLEHRRELAQVLRRDRELARKMNDEVGAVLQDAVRGTLAGAFEDLRERYSQPTVRSFLSQVEADVLEYAVPLAREAASPEEGEGRFRIYTVHVLVDRRGLEGCPVVHETAPTVAGLFGTIDRMPVAPGVYATDHTMIRSGSLLEADGGFLIIAAEDALADQGVSHHLRRVLKHRRLEIRAVESTQGMPGVNLLPEAIDLDVKVVLVGDWQLYEALYRASSEFAETFRVKAEFEPDMDAAIPNLRHFCRIAARIAKKAGALPLSKSGLAALVEHGVRSSGRQGKITTRFSEVGEVVREADYWASRVPAKEIGAEHVRKAIDRMAERNRLAETRLQDLIDREILLIDTKGRRVGRVNGLSVYDLGYYMFGKPTVITASTGVGRAGIINVEREARLSGGIYDKGVLIIAGFFRRTFAQRRPLSLTASVCFEQSYSGVDGDSASVAEVAALVSELSGVAVDQGIAVTGSLNQHGAVQPIGGVNEKIEGFFHVCARRGLTGSQGVVIPRANVGDLMLAEEVVDACRAGKFHLWSVVRVEEALEILLGEPAGVRRADGAWTPGTLYAKVEARLVEYAAGLGGGEESGPIPGVAALLSSQSSRGRRADAKRRK